MAPRSNTLFTVPIAPQGSVTCTSPADRVYVLTFVSQPDNRLTTGFCQALLLALDIVELRHPPGVVVTTSGIQKFYSNGLDLEHANATPGFFRDSLYRLWRRLLTYPMPTVALLNGHAFAGALMLALMHDYRIQNPHRGYLCLNELELGVPLRPPMSSVFRQKLSPYTYRTLVLEAKRYKALEALKEGIVDGLGGIEEVLAFVEEGGLVKKAGGVYGLLKEEMWRETVAYLESWEEEQERDGKAQGRREKEKVEGERRVKGWETGTKAKL